MKSFLTSIFFLFVCFFSYAQYTEVINSRRPGFSDSPYSVGTKVYQVEAGLFYNKVGNHSFWDEIPELNTYSASSIGSDIMLRTGQFFERLEFNLDMALVYENRDYSSPEITELSGFGFRKMTLGAKYLLYEPKYADKSKEIRSWKKRNSFDTRRLIPAVGVYAGLNTNLLMDMYKNPEGLSPRFAIFTQNNLSDRFIVVLNFITDKVFTEQRENSYIVTVTYNLYDKWSLFAENQGFFRKNVPNDFQFGAGGAYLINNNMQADFSARMIFDENGDNNYLIGGGVSWRLDRHQDELVQNKVDNNEPGTTKEKRGFLSVITFGLFDKKNSQQSGSMPNVKKRNAKTRSLEAPVNKKAQKARKKQNKQLVKEQKAREKAQKKQAKKEEKN